MEPAANGLPPGSIPAFTGQTVADPTLPDGATLNHREIEPPRLFAPGIHIGAVQPTATEIDRRAEARVVRPGAAANALPCFQHNHLASAVNEGARRGQSRRAGTDHSDIVFAHAQGTPAAVSRAAALPTAVSGSAGRPE